MLKVDFISTEFLLILGSEFEHLPEDVLHNLEIKLNCSQEEIAEAAKWVNGKPNR